MILVGPLAAPEMLAVFALSGDPVRLPGELKGGADAGIGGDWPRWRPGQGEVAGVAVRPDPALMRYLAIMGLSPRRHDGLAVWGHGDGGGADWSGDRAALMAEVARDLLALPPDEPAADIARRLPRIAEIAWGRLRAALEADPSACLPEADASRVELLARREAYARYFSVEEISLRHRRYDGGWSPVLDREVFRSADAALLLPYDPGTDLVMVISQFRIGPLARGQAQCWMLEPIAGRIDAGERPEDAARREAQEEAGIEIGRIHALPPHYPTPGANSEFFYPFVGLADLSSQRAGAGFGLAEEGEDIATHILPRAELLRLVMAGQIQCGPLIAMAFWLDRMADQIAGSLAGS
ncbi:NUDIX domain-containing protein [Paracoccus isoporae]|uniref:NUDIX domain-containing protein n=1 Tax=Paracoccus isoporae TaxID=591205 RepID=UPI00115FFF58|nr:NUDIX domain-containing protein [Paracoccus isoporae]